MDSLKVIQGIFKDLVRELGESAEYIALREKKAKLITPIRDGGWIKDKEGGE